MLSTTNPSLEYDLELVSNALAFVQNGSLDFIFGSKDVFNDVAIITYDDKYIYIFSINETTYAKIPHDISYDWEKQQKGWSSNLRVKEFFELLPDEIKNYWFISGGLFSNLTEIQQQRKSIYTSVDSYLATIIHELGHIVFNKNNARYYTDKNETLKYMETAVKLYGGGQLSGNFNINIPAYSGLSEVFAFCTEYAFAEKFAVEHKTNIDKTFGKKIESAIDIEKGLDFRFQDSSLADSHFYSWVIGKILMEKYPTTWHRVLLDSKVTL